MLRQKICQLSVKGQQGLALLTPSLLWQFSSVTKCDAFFLSPMIIESVIIEVALLEAKNAQRYLLLPFLVMEFS